MRKILFMLAAIMFAACGDVDLGLTHKVELKNPYAVTPDEAVQLLQTVIGGESTRSISVSDIKTLSKSDFVPTTRSASDGEVIYIVDIEDGGSAILGADKRMEPIYAVLDKTRISVEDLVTSYETRLGEGSEDIGDYILGLLNNAIVTDMQDVEPAGVEMPIIPRDQYWIDTVIVARQEPLLRTKWGQDPPFNNNYPEHPTLGVPYPAGCGPIALAQILYYNRFPNSINGVTFDWDLIEEYEVGNNSHSDSATIEVGNFVYRITSTIDAYQSVSYSGNTVNTLATGITVGQANHLLTTAGYQNVATVDYTLSSVISMVYDKQLPVYARGGYYDNDNNWYGHAWVIDGCDVYRIEEWRRHYTTSTTYVDNIESSQSFNIVYCNFGWDGDYDGDYDSGLFDTPNGNFSTDKKLITYSLN